MCSSDLASDPDVADGPKYDCGPDASPIVAEDGKTRCEFIADEQDNAHVVFSNVRFHEVEVSAN